MFRTVARRKNMEEYKKHFIKYKKLASDNCIFRLLNSVRNWFCYI